MLVTDDAQIHGPNEPYPLWQCMRADGSTYDSRDGVSGKQWVPTPATSTADTGSLSVPPNISSLPKGPLVRAIPQSTSVAGDEPAAPDLGPPPAGAPAGKWVADQCERLPPEKACARYTARRDLLRRQIYAANPSDRDLYAPEEQDLTVMLYSACGR